MKTHFVSFLLLVSVFSKGQDLVKLQDPENSYQLLHEGWQYKMGEHPTSVYADYMEEGWKPIRPEADIHESIPADAKTGIGWMRLRFTVSGEARNQQLSMLIKQSIASEIYLNGRIIKQYGNISEEASKIKAFNPLYKPISLILSDDSIQVIAVRFVVQPKAKYITYYGVTNPFFTARLMRNENALEIYKGIYRRPWLDFFMQGIIFMVFILHISFYIMYREQRANLLFALSALIQAIGSQFHIYYYFMASPEQKFTFAIMASVMYAIGNLLMFASIHNYLKLQSKTSFRILAGIQLISLVIGAFWYRTGFNSLTGFMPIMTYMFILFLSITALRKKVKEAGILTIGFSLSIFAFIIFLGNAILDQGDHLLRVPFNLYSFFFLVYLLAPPGSVSLFLANDFARTSKKLQQKLAEVEMLSEINVQSEREKQEILSSQNLQLEAKVEERTADLKKSLNELKSTQTQLIQSEKMASLGELTAGIAHEIQNPLNFVNNFSEVNTELIDEMKKEIKAGNYPEVEHLAHDLEANMEKITLHGKRADAIVKSMLQHSRASSGEKEPIDINALADEFLRLSFHGMRARDKSFNAELHTDFDENIGDIKLISQDIGRVLLNMYNNAFQAVTEKKRAQPVGFDPKVTVTTQKLSDIVEIRITDNGNGIPEKILNKIFQPFFTTKPTGEGTGLGLSLSYDIVKAHGGDINVVTREGGGTEFTIRLPVT
jgi:two-component system, NtrC family, sensor kinase